MRLRGMLPNTSPSAFVVVLMRCSRRITPASSSRQYQLDRSPRSNPTVSFCPEIFLLAFTAAVLPFFIAGLLYLLCLEHVDNLGAYTASRPETGLLIPSDFVNKGSGGWLLNPSMVSKEV